MEKMILDQQAYITTQPEETDHRYVCKNLFEYNVRATNGILKDPGVSINLYLKTSDNQVIGGIFCDTFSKCLYIDVMWIHEDYRKYGYGKALITEVERIAREHGCIFSHTTTFSYQSPGFYQKMGYEVFGIIDDYPEGIKQYFLKKKL